MLSPARSRLPSISEGRTSSRFSGLRATIGTESPYPLLARISASTWTYPRDAGVVDCNWRVDAGRGSSTREVDVIYPSGGLRRGWRDDTHTPAGRHLTDGRRGSAGTGGGAGGRCFIEGSCPCPRWDSAPLAKVPDTWMVNFARRATCSGPLHNRTGTSRTTAQRPSNTPRSMPNMLWESMNWGFPVKALRGSFRANVASPVDNLNSSKGEPPDLTPAARQVPPCDGEVANHSYLLRTICSRGQARDGLWGQDRSPRVDSMN